MYGVFSKKSLLAAACLAVGCVLLLGVAARTVRVSATTRVLPIYSVQAQEKVIALGINCAWDDSDIDRLLEILQTRNVKATFFLVGDWCDRYPQAVIKIAEMGHELGSHSDTHPDMTQLSRAQIEDQLARSGEKLEALTGKYPKLFRPPSGAYNDLVVQTARSLGWEVIQWSNDSIDWKDPPVDVMVERVLQKARPGDITLFHAGKANTPPALEIIIDRLLADGWRFATVGEMIYPAPYRIDHSGRQSAA